MKRTLLFILAVILLPLAIVAGVLYVALLVLNLFISAVMDALDKGIGWVDVNITANLR